jgi:DNA helicase-2/ATP-dependent DNA helicase PcrA
MQYVLEGLNEKQKEAVKNTEGPNLIIAGAGSGKTKVLTHKIAYLIKEKGVLPWNILAITFTNKAANEMKVRIEKIIGDMSKDMWIGTFHSICVKILRKHINKIGFDSSFVIFDTIDQKNLIKQCIKQLNLNEENFQEKSVSSEISNLKNDMLKPEDYMQNVKGQYRKEKIAEIYTLYQQKLKQNNALDFDDIINYCIEILINNNEILEYYSDKFKYILIDEYQDTNKA